MAETHSTRQVVVTCSCGQFPLADAQQPNPTAGWQVAAAHAELNPLLCKPQMAWADVPVGLAVY